MELSGWISKYPDYRLHSDRFNSFNFSNIPDVDKDKFATCGFYQWGHNVVACFHCGVKLTNFEHPLEICTWQVHYTKKPSCRYVYIMTKGATFKTYTRLYPSIYTQPSAFRSIMFRTNRYRDTIRATASINQTPSDENRNNSNNVPTLIKIQSFFLPKLRASAKILSSSYNKSTQTSTNGALECFICYSGDRDVIFFPCRHLATCIKCAFVDDKCPICRIYYTHMEYCFV